MPDNEKKDLRAMRLLELYLIFLQETDKDHALSVGDLLSRLKEAGYPCTRQTLYEDMKALDETKIMLSKVRRKHTVYYYGTGGVFNAAELRILFDAVQAAGFIPEEETNELIHKISIQADSLQATEMETNIIRFNRRKHTNHEIFTTISACASAILEGSQVSFRYFHLDFHAQPVNDYEKPITVDPLQLIFQNDRFYLIAYAPFRKGLRHYRIDRMADTVKTGKPRTKASAKYSEDPDKYLARIFQMFSGVRETVTLEFTSSALGSVFDKFGENAPVEQVDEHTGRLTESIEISSTFFSWIDQFDGEMAIVSPASVVDQYKSHLQKLLSKYN